MSKTGTANRFGRLEGLLVVAIPVVGVLLAMWMYFGSLLIPDGRTNNGVLLSPPLSVNIFASEQLETVSEQEHWAVVVTSDGPCDETCRHMLYLARQSHIALDRDQPRVRRFLLTPTKQDDMTEEFAEFLQQNHADLAVVKGSIPVLEATQDNASHIFVVDPLGNVILWYDKTHDGKELLKDLEKLLKLSRIG